MAEEEGAYKSAAKLYAKLANECIDDYATAANLLFHNAECLFFAGKTYAATEAYKNLVKNYRMQIPLNTVFERMRQLANNYRDGIGTFLWIADPLAAINTYRFIIDETPSITASLSDRHELIQRLINDTQLKEAVNECQKIIKELPNNAETRYRLAQLLNELAKSADGDGRISKSAAREAQAYLNLNTGDEQRMAEMREIIQNAHESEATRLLNLAKYYLSPRHIQKNAARRYLFDITRDFPDTAAAIEANEIISSQLSDNVKAGNDQE